MDYEARRGKLKAEWDQILLSISQPMSRMAFLEGQMGVLDELRAEEKAATESAAKALADQQAAAPESTAPDPAA